MMSNVMTHEEARAVLEALALDALEAFERAAALAHVAECEACSAELATLRRAAEQLAYAVTPVPMSPPQHDRVRRRLLARAAADRAGHAGEPRPTPSVVPIGAAPSARAKASVLRNPAIWAAVAALLVAVVSRVSTVSARHDRDELRRAMSQMAAAEGVRRAALDSLRREMADRDQLIANLTGPAVAVMSLVSADPRSPTARMFWDQQHDAWTFVAHNLTVPRPGRTYQLWLVTPTSKISAGTFVPNAAGEAIVRATYRLDSRALAAVAVTDEPERGSAQPTTPPFLAVTGGR